MNIHTLQTRTPPKPIDARASGPLVEGHTRAGDWHRPTDCNVEHHQLLVGSWPLVVRVAARRVEQRNATRTNLQTRCVDVVMATCTNHTRASGFGQINASERLRLEHTHTHTLTTTS